MGAAGSTQPTSSNREVHPGWGGGDLIRFAHDAPRPPIDMPCGMDADSACNCLEDGLSSVVLRYEPQMCANVLDALEPPVRTPTRADQDAGRPDLGVPCAKKAAGPLRRIPPVVVAAMTNAAAKGCRRRHARRATRPHRRVPGRPRQLRSGRDPHDACPDACRVARHRNDSGHQASGYRHRISTRPGNR